MSRGPAVAAQPDLLTPPLARRPTVRRRARLIVWAVGLLAVLFFALAVALRQADGTPFDVAITETIQRVEAPSMTVAMTAVSVPGYAPWSWLMLGAIVTALLTAGWYREIPFVLVGEVSSALVASIKLLVERPRPAGDSIRVVGALLDYSFPSGHVVTYVCLYGFLFFLVYVRVARSWQRTAMLILVGLPIALVGLSRVYLGYHWASDVVGGYALGSVILWLLIEAYWLLVVARRTAGQDVRAYAPSETA